MESTTGRQRPGQRCGEAGSAKAEEEQPELFLDVISAAVAHEERVIRVGEGVSESRASRALALSEITRKVLERDYSEGA